MKSTLRKLGGAFARAKGGGVAMMFALAMPPMTMMAVCGLDIHRASSVRQSLQDALDAATLAAARSDETTDAGVRAVGLRVLRANLAQFPYVTLNEATNSTNFDLNADGSVTSFARVSVDTLVAGAFLGNALDINVDSLVMRSSQRIEIALVIDTTGSMAQEGRIGAARTAAENLVRQLEASAQGRGADAIRISLVPFSDTVRPVTGFGTTNNQTSAAATGWLATSPSHTGASGPTGLFSASVNRFKLFDDLRIGWGGCVESRPYPNDVSDVAPRSNRQDTLFVPFFSPDWPDAGTFPDTNWTYWTSTNYSNYVNDYIDEDGSGVQGLLNGITNQVTRAARLQDAWFSLSKDVGKYTRTRLRSTRGVHGPNYLCDVAPVIRLTNNYNAVVAGIRAMQPSGDTNIPMGLMWGWHTLSPNAPFADGVGYSDEETQKIIVLMTDGDNNAIGQPNPDNALYNGLGLIRQGRIGVDQTSTSAQRRTALNGRLTELCGNLRTRGIQVFAIGVEVSSGTQSLLDNCATTPAMSFAASSTAEMTEAFANVTGQIQRLRIAR